MKKKNRDIGKENLRGKNWVCHQERKVGHDCELFVHHGYWKLWTSFAVQRSGEDCVFSKSGQKTEMFVRYT